TLSNSTFYSLNFGYLGVKYQSSHNGMQPHEFWTFIDTSSGDRYNYEEWERLHSNEKPDGLEGVNPPIKNDLTHFYDGTSIETIWRDDQTKSFTFKGDLTSQIHKSHLIKTGIELQYHDILYVDIQDGGSSLSEYGEYKFRNGKEVSAPPGLDPEFGKNRWVFHAYPLLGGAYIQDKFERESLIINAGIRFDWFVPGDMISKDKFKEQWRNATGLETDWTTIKYKISPRFGISFPISSKTVIFFSYGHFNQLPEMQFYYRDPFSSKFIGNPHLDYEQTVLYEFGFTRQLFQNWSIDIKNYAKDISQQVGTTTLKSGQTGGIYDNNGYARARGLEFRLEKHHADYVSGNLNYTVQWATGYTSSAFEDYINSINFMPNPIRERRLGWDVRHQVMLQGTVAIPEKKRPEIFGRKIPGNWNATVLLNYSTGMPYTPYTRYLIEQQTKYNTETGPSITTTDLKIQKYFKLSYNSKVTVILDIFNIFDQNNTQINYGFNRVTGKPYKYGDTNPEGQYYEDYYLMYYRMDPRQFSTGRYAKLGIRLDW
ncbi:MAG: TonB-dependent receptor, partial [Bacteroidales bacterium]|nr:TonB-dependent receptor [Bacteroidales bacterium]